MAAVRGMKPGTIITHLAEAIKAGLQVKTENLGVTDHMRNLVERAIVSPEIDGNILRMGPIKAKCEQDYSEEITWDTIKIVVAVLIKEHGVKDDKLCWDQSVIGKPSSPQSQVAASTSSANLGRQKSISEASASSFNHGSQLDKKEDRKKWGNEEEPDKDGSERSRQKLQSAQEPKRGGGGGNEKNKRELPDWMKSVAAKENMKKKMKKNNLFK